MNRRNFFSSLFRGEQERFFLGVQLVIATLSDDDADKRLRALVAEAARKTSPRDKRTAYKRVAALLLEQLPYWEYAFWEYDAEGDAVGAFEEWANEIQASIATEPEEIGLERDEARRLSNDKWYVVATLLFALDNAPALAPVKSAAEAIEEENYWTRSTLQKIVESVTAIDFEYCERDALFVMPGTDQDGFSWEDLHGEGWEYLRPLTW